MELRTVDPRSLKVNPDNPRRTKATPEQDAQLAANIKEVGLLQPPTVRPDGEDLVILYGERRVRCAIMAGLIEIPVLVRGLDDGADAVRAFAENVVRAQMGPVDQWRAIEALIGSNWTEEAIATAFAYPVRLIRRLRLLAHIHPAILDHIAKGDMPREEEIRIIAAALREEQAEVWKKHKPKRGQNANWWEIARPLQKTRLLKKHARFDAETAQRHGIHWEDDLFGPGGEDNLYTARVEEFFAAQEEWLAANLPGNGLILTTDQYGQPDLPPRAERVYGKPKASDTIGHYLDRRTGEIHTVAFHQPEARPKGGKGTGSIETGGLAVRARAEVTQKGLAMIGDYRTDALHQALAESPIDDLTLIGLLVLALAGQNVAVQSPNASSRGDRGALAHRLMDGGVLTCDAGLMRETARQMLRQVLSCRDGMSNSGTVARIAGDAIHADQFLPNMATEDFLRCLSKAAIEKAASAVNVLPRNTGKATRAALIEQAGQGRYLLPVANFRLSDTERASLQSHVIDETGEDPDDLGTDGSPAGTTADADEGDGAADLPEGMPPAQPTLQPEPTRTGPRHHRAVQS